MSYTEKDKLWRFLKEELPEIKINLQKDNIDLYYQNHGWSNDFIVLCIDNTKDWMLISDMDTIQVQCPDCDFKYNTDESGFIENTINLHTCTL